MGRNFRNIALQLFPLIGVAFLACSANNSADSNDCNCSFNQPFQESTFNIGETSTGILAVAQSFTPTTALTIAGLKVSVGKQGNSAPAVLVSIHADATGVPAATPMLSAVSVSTTNAEPNFESFCFSADCSTTLMSLSANTKYWIVVQRAGGLTTTSSTDFIKAGLDNQNFGSELVMMQTTLVPATWSAYSGTALVFRFDCSNTGVTGCAL